MLVDNQITALENIENDPLETAGNLQKFTDCPHCNLCRPLRRKSKYAGGDAAKRNGMQAFHCGQLQTVPIAGGQQLFILISHFIVDNGSYRMKHILRGQVEARRDLGLAGGFLLALFLHDLVTRQSQLNARHSVDDVVDTAVAG